MGQLQLIWSLDHEQVSCMEIQAKHLHMHEIHQNRVFECTPKDLLVYS